MPRRELRRSSVSLLGKNAPPANSNWGRFSPQAWARDGAAPNVAARMAHKAPALLLLMVIAHLEARPQEGCPRSVRAQRRAQMTEQCREGNPAARAAVTRSGSPG